MYRKIAILLFLYLAFELSSNGAFGDASGSTVAYEIEGVWTNVDMDSIGLYDYSANRYNLIQKTALKKSGDEVSFLLKGKAPHEGMYFLGKIIPSANPNQQAQEYGVPILIGPDKKIKLQADGKDLFNSATSTEGDFNTRFLTFLRKTEQLQRVLNESNRQFTEAYQQQNQTLATQFKRQYDSLMVVKTQFHADAVNQTDIVGRIARVFYFPPYGVSQTTQNYTNEKDYFANEFLKYINYTDPIIGYVPIFYQKINSYTNTLLGQFYLNYDDVTGLLDQYYAHLPKGSKSQQMFLLGAMHGAANAQQSRNQSVLDVYVTYAKRYVEQFPDDSLSLSLKEDVKKFGATLMGSVPPDLEFENPEGKLMKLSALKGKVVLLDFWASWCGPCRKENPNVVKAYDAFHAKGFEVFNVSLDQDKQKWIAAIEQDGLKWPYHISDLKGWQSEGAKLYGVSSIPSTFLLDKDGKIVAKNLRGEQLEKKLEELLK